jgi:hypothetical protein
MSYVFAFLLSKDEGSYVQEVGFYELPQRRQNIFLANW